MGCVASARFNMKATLLRAVSPVTPEETWHYVWKQDPVSGNMYQEKVYDDVSTPEIIEGGGIDIDVQARGVIDGGIRVAGTTETFDELYRATDWVKMTFSADVVVTRTDQVTNIRDGRTGQVIWIEEEGEGGPTVFNVMGVTPIIDPLGNHVENFALLQRHEVQ